MSFESNYRARQGAREINKIYDFISNLVIKNNYEANAAATSESISEYFKYNCAYSRIDDFADYLLEDRQKYEIVVYNFMNSLKNKPYTLTMSIVKSLTNSTINGLTKGYKSKSVLYKDYLNGLRYARIYYYDERNTYYRQFMGLPNTKKDYVYLTNFDISEDGYTEVTDFSKPPLKNITYYFKDEKGVYKPIGYLDDWFDELGELLSENFYVLNVVAAHEINYEQYPLTYSYYIQQKNINNVIKEYPNLTYLRFIGNNFTPYYLHESPNYTIISYMNGIFDATELEFFFKSYNKARQQVIMDYIEGFDKKQPLYNLLMIENLLYYTVINYTASYIEKYSLGIYTEENIDDILTSNGYSNLTKISSFEIKSRIVKNLNDLIANKGNNNVLELILSKIIKDENSNLKRYYLEKEYKTDFNGEIKIDTSRGLEDSIDLVFREVPAIDKNETTKNTSETYREYNDITAEDELWGGVELTDTQATKNTKKEVLKKELLALNFNSILTRYITLTKTVDIIESQRTLRDSLYLMFKYFDLKDYPDFFHNKVSFEMGSVTPAAIFAAMCWLQQMKFYNDPNKIIKDNIIINNSAVFRNFGKLVVDRQSFENTVIYDGSPVTQYDISADIANWKIQEFIEENRETFVDFFGPGVDGEHIEIVRIKDTILKPYYEQQSDGRWRKIKPMIAPDEYKHLEAEEESIEDYIVVYRFYANGVQLGDVTSETSFSDIIEDYQHQMPNLIERLNKKLAESYDFNTYQAWLFLQNQSRKDNSILEIFKGYDTFSDFIIEYCDSNSIIDWMEQELKVPIINYSRKPTMKNICYVLEVLNTAFKNWVHNNFSTMVYSSEDNMSGDISYINDMKILFNEFLSVYSELYSVDFKYTLGNKEIQDYAMQLYYNPLNILFTQKFTDKIELTETLKSLLKTSLNDENDISIDTITLFYDFVSRFYSSLTDAINKNMILDEKTNEYIPEDPFLYEMYNKFMTQYNEWIGLNGSFTKFHVTRPLDDAIKLNSVLKIKSSDKGVKTYHE